MSRTRPPVLRDDAYSPAELVKPIARLCWGTEPGAQISSASRQRRFRDIAEMVGEKMGFEEDTIRELWNAAAPSARGQFAPSPYTAQSRGVGARQGSDTIRTAEQRRRREREAMEREIN